jgi:hypothetical protein
MKEYLTRDRARATRRMSTQRRSTAPVKTVTNNLPHWKQAAYYHRRTLELLLLGDVRGAIIVSRLALQHEDAHAREWRCAR